MNFPSGFFEMPPAQGPVGLAPIRYIRELPGGVNAYTSSLKVIPGGGKNPLDRAQVRAVCIESKVNPLVAYACIMAWGWRNFSNYRLTLKQPALKNLKSLITKLRSSKLSRKNDFSLTQNSAKNIKGLGISFYTKLLFFLRPAADAYILDQWTAKTATVLFPGVGIKLTAAGLPSPQTTPRTYESFCAALDSCTGTTGWGKAWTTGEEVERTIFDRPNGQWRNWLKQHLPSKEKVLRPTPKALPRHAMGSSRDSLLSRFGDVLKQSYIARLNTGAQLPEGCGNLTGNSLHLRSAQGHLFQIKICRGKVYAQLYVSAAEGYEKILKAAGELPVGISANGTHAINCQAEVAGGFGSAEEYWPAITESAVEATQRLFEYFEPYLPDTGR